MPIEPDHNPRDYGQDYTEYGFANENESRSYHQQQLDERMNSAYEHAQQSIVSTLSGNVLESGYHIGASIGHYAVGMSHHVDIKFEDNPELKRECEFVQEVTENSCHDNHDSCTIL